MDTTKELQMAKKPTSKKQHKTTKASEMLDDYLKSDQAQEVRDAIEAMGLSANTHAGSLKELLNLLYPGGFYKKG
jgi:ribosome-binding protein aMBF1 (putative translation factor)